MFSLLSFSQNTEKINALKKLGRDSLIKLAVNKINERYDPKNSARALVKFDTYFDPKNYDRIVVKYDANSLIVDFNLSLNFISLKSCFYLSVSIDLINGLPTTGLYTTCDKPKFYMRTKQDQKKIDFVFNAINKDNEIGNMPNQIIPEGTNMSIIEKINHYEVSVSDDYFYSSYKVNKITGKIVDAIHKEYAQSDNQKELFEIIK